MYVDEWDGSLGEDHEGGGHGHGGSSEATGGGEGLSTPGNADLDANVDCDCVFFLSSDSLVLGQESQVRWIRFKFGGEFHCQGLAAEAALDLVEIVEGSAVGNSVLVTLELSNGFFSGLVEVVCVVDGGWIWVHEENIVVFIISTE